MSEASNISLIRDKTVERLRDIAAQSRGALGYCVIDLTNGDRFALSDGHVFPQASAIKIPVLMEVFRQANDGKFALTDRRRVAKEDKTPGSGVLIELGDDTVELSIFDLCVLMIVLSDNTATNMLIELAGMDKVNSMLSGLGFQKTCLRRVMMDTAAAQRGDENVSTPAEAAKIMETIFQGKFISRKVCDDILAILKKPKVTNLCSGLPPGTLVASKPGGITGVVTEWAVVLLKHRPYVVAVMENYTLGQDAPSAIREISRVLYEYFERLDRATPFGAYFPISVPLGP